MNPFEVMQQDIDDFIAIANYLIGLGKDSTDRKPKARTPQKNERIRVNDKTATGGWW